MGASLSARREFPKLRAPSLTLRAPPPTLRGASLSARRGSPELRAPSLTLSGEPNALSDEALSPCDASLSERRAPEGVVDKPKDEKGYATERKGHATERKGHATERKGCATERKGLRPEVTGQPKTVTLCGLGVTARAVRTKRRAWLRRCCA